MSLRRNSTNNMIQRTERTPLLDSVRMNENNDAGNKNNTSEYQSGVSWGVAAFLLVNTALGAGMLNYPYAFNQVGGVMVATIMQIILLVFIASTMFILVYCADFNQDDTYHDVLLSMCGKRAQQFSALSIMLTCYGINVTFLVIIGDQYDRMFNSLLANYIDELWFLDRKFTIFATAVLFIWPMCYARRLDFLRHASILGMFAMLYVAFLTVYEHYRLDEATIAKIISNRPSEPTAHQDASANLPKDNGTNTTTSNQNEASDAPAKSIQWFEPLTVVPVLCFAYQTHEVIVPVYACMRQRCIAQFMKASIFGLIILFFLYNLVGAYGYLTFGANVGPDIISLYDAKDPIVVIGIAALVIKFITTYPPLMFCGRGALDGLYGEMRKLSPDEFKSAETTRRIVITTVWFYSTVCLAIFAPDIAVTLQLLGSMASINVFVFPGMCLVSLTRRLRRTRQFLLIDETPDYSSQRQAKDYHLISGSYFSNMKRQATGKDQNLSNLDCGLSNANGSTTTAATTSPSFCHKPQQFTATFASLIEFENNQSSSNDNRIETKSINGLESGSSGHQLARNNDCYKGQHQARKLTSYNNSQQRNQRRHEDFARLLMNSSGVYCSQDHFSPFSRTINDSQDDYCDCEARGIKKSDMINSSNNGNSIMTNALRRGQGTADLGIDISSTHLINNNKDPFSDLSSRLASNNYQYHNQFAQNSWNNRSVTGSILDRLGSSMSPSVVAQIGISPIAAAGLYSFAAFLIIFGVFIFVLELVSVFGFI